jgi:hypothetical protein
VCGCVRCEFRTVGRPVVQQQQQLGSIAEREGERGALDDDDARGLAGLQRAAKQCVPLEFTAHPCNHYAQSLCGAPLRMAMPGWLAGWSFRASSASPPTTLMPPRDSLTPCLLTACPHPHHPQDTSQPARQQQAWSNSGAAAGAGAGAVEAAAASVVALAGESR